MTPPPKRLLAFNLIGTGGVLGAYARYRVDLRVTAEWGRSFPWGTLLINLSGCFALGLFLAIISRTKSDQIPLRLFVATGFLGAYTTFSTFSYESVRLIQDGHVPKAVAYLGASLAGGIAGYVLGDAIGRIVVTKCKTLDKER